MTTAFYVPGTSEKDMSKVIMSAQLVAGNVATNTDNITTNTAAIATINASRASASTFGLAEVDGTTIQASAGVLSTVTPLPAPIKASLGSDVALNNTANYFDGPSIAQGTSGTWLVTGTVTVTDPSSTAQIACKLWDGTTVIASAESRIGAAASAISISLSGVLASPAANIKISCKSNSTTSAISFNFSGNSKDSTITAIRIA